ncbi:MAG: KpsF/GutQ family sugar-phosphate isomerase [Planctomycetota bacterium]|nr:KpsF/GutQ family sugar-phosphate isomerase [Planctomycetota bacterium]MDA1202427.1 KpsF/GutQ family sugar-phosphate isomerase [Planctomycetota bacterium]
MDQSHDESILARGREILEAEGEAVLAAAAGLDAAFCRAVRLIESCTGSVVVTGIGKAGLVARKISATLASTGTPSHFLHPAEAMHGDLGALRGDDVVLALSQSGETEEITRLLPHVNARQVPIVALTAKPESTLGRAATVVVPTGSVREACGLGLAPSTSTALMLSLGDALALVTSSRRQFTPEDFAARHPGGSLGRQLMLVEDAMRPVDECRLATPEETVRAVFARPLPARRTGAVMIVTEGDRLEGIFTDSDLARLFEHRHDDLLDAAIKTVMTARPATVPVGTRLRDAVAILETRRLSELPVTDGAGKVVGLLDIVDLVGLVPDEAIQRPRAPAPVAA